MSKTGDKAKPKLGRIFMRASQTGLTVFFEPWTEACDGSIPIRYGWDRRVPDVSIVTCFVSIVECGDWD